MTDITANEYRTAAKVCAAEEDWSRAKALRELADLIDANDARDAEREARHLASKLAHDAEITALAIIQMKGESGWWRGVECDKFADRTYESMTGDNQQAIRSGVSAVLAHLQSTSRLIPAGGMALTAEQVEDVRTVLGKATTEYGAMELTAAWARLRALFPATEPAEDSVGDPLQAWKEFLKPKPIGWYSTMTREFATEHFGFPEVTGLLECTHTASDGGTWGWCGGDWELLVYPPAPAVPAEEETKAEEKLVAHRDSKGDIYVGHALVAFKHRSYEQIRRWFNEAHPGGISERRYRAVLDLLDVEASSPVVPAPTETGPWQTWQEVPEGVRYTSNRTPFYVWENINKVRHFRRTYCADDPMMVSDADEKTMQYRAPFVAAEEG